MLNMEQLCSYICTNLQTVAQLALFGWAGTLHKKFTINPTHQYMYCKHSELGGHVLVLAHPWLCHCLQINVIIMYVFMYVYVLTTLVKIAQSKGRLGRIVHLIPVVWQNVMTLIMAFAWKYALTMDVYVLRELLSMKTLMSVQRLVNAQVADLYNYLRIITTSQLCIN